MRRLRRAGAFFVRDRSGRAALLLGAGLALLLPRALQLGSPGPTAAGFRDGLAAGPGAGGAALAGLWGIFLLAGVLLLWQGVVSGDVDRGGFRTVLVRPVWRPGLYLARHGAALLLLCLTVLTAGSVLRVAGGAAAPDPGGLLLSSLLTGWALGGLVLLLSALLDRGDALAAGALFLAPAAVDGLAASGSPAAAAAAVLAPALPPVISLRELRHALLAGGPTDGGDLAAVLAYGAAAVVLAAVRLRTREFRSG